ncbi:SIMPL domain-containing protein [Candidatus Falkowbacteria bacterium]|nr:SIMPL domain-containing protein [Candidatus Falkowbacteria bacterium]
MVPNKIVTIFASIALFIAAIYLGILSWNAIKAHDYIGVSEEQRHSIMITGEGRVIGVPDIANIQLGYSVEKKTVAEAQKDNTEKMNAAVKKIKDDLKIEAKDIQTTSYNIYPAYDWLDGRQRLRGYQVSQNISIKARDLEKVSKILDLAANAGLNQAGGLSFEIDDPEKLKQQAREEALKQAKEKAEALADVAGVKLGKIVSFSESSYEPPVFRSYKALQAEGVGGGEETPSIEAGSAEIQVTATVEYEIL